MRPSRARFVCAAMNPSAVVPSSMGSSTSPTLRIWNRWSMTQIESNPASSAVWQTRASVSPIAASPPGHVKEEMWSPSFTKGRLYRKLPRRSESWPSAEEVHLLRHHDVFRHRPISADAGCSAHEDD